MIEIYTDSPTYQKVVIKVGDKFPNYLPTGVKIVGIAVIKDHD